MNFRARTPRARYSAAIIATLLVCSTQAARAQNTPQPANETADTKQQRAEELYKEGALLLGAGRYWEAELRFQESLRLLRGRGTLLNLAICHENLGRLASAWHELKSLEEEAAPAGDTARVETAREHLAWIEPQLSFLEIGFADEAQVSQLVVELDGHALAAVSAKFPLDPGRHQLRVSAPGKRDWSTELTFQNGNRPQTVVVPSLMDSDVVAVVPPAPEVGPKAVAPVVQRPPEPAPKADYSGVYIAGAATLTLTVGAVVSAFAYYDRRAAYHDAISNPGTVTDDEASARRDSAEKMAWINGSLIVGASVGAAVTGFLWYRASRTNTVRVAEGAWIAPLIVGSGGGVRAGASF